MINKWVELNPYTNRTFALSSITAQAVLACHLLTEELSDEVDA